MTGHAEDASGFVPSPRPGASSRRPGPTSTGKFNLLCKRGHDRKINADKRGRCMVCRRENHKKHYHKNRSAQWKHNGILNADGGIFTIHDFNRAFQIQGGRCKTCDIHQSELTRALAVDHDHATGFFRGLLCVRCNSALGWVKDNAKIMRALIKYLEDPR